MFSITSYSYERPKKTSTLLGLFIFVFHSLERKKHSLHFLSLDQNSLVCFHVPDRMNVQHLSFGTIGRVK